jgi:hypothetical protein
MELVLRQIPDTIGQVEIVKIDGDSDCFPWGYPYVSEEDAVGAAAQIMGVQPRVFEIIYEEAC